MPVPFSASWVGVSVYFGEEIPAVAPFDWCIPRHGALGCRVGKTEHSVLGTEALPSEGPSDSVVTSEDPLCPELSRCKPPLQGTLCPNLQAGGLNLNLRSQEAEPLVPRPSPTVGVSSIPDLVIHVDLDPVLCHSSWVDLAHKGGGSLYQSC